MGGFLYHFQETLFLGSLAAKKNFSPIRLREISSHLGGIAISSGRDWAYSLEMVLFFPRDAFEDIFHFFPCIFCVLSFDRVGTVPGFRV